MILHDKLKSIIPVKDNNFICPYCMEVMLAFKSIRCISDSNNTYYDFWCSCSKLTRLYASNTDLGVIDSISIILVLKQEVKISLLVDFKTNTSLIIGMNAIYSDINISHANFDLLDELSLKQKLQLYITFS